jgi:hypothetical protein
MKNEFVIPVVRIRLEESEDTFDATDSETPQSTQVLIIMDPDTKAKLAGLSTETDAVRLHIQGEASRRLSFIPGRLGVRVLMAPYEQTVAVGHFAVDFETFLSWEQFDYMIKDDLDA